MIKWRKMKNNNSRILFEAIHFNKTDDGSYSKKFILNLFFRIKYESYLWRWKDFPIKWIKYSLCFIVFTMNIAKHMQLIIKHPTNIRFDNEKYLARKTDCFCCVLRINLSFVMSISLISILINKKYNVQIEI